MGGVVSSKAWDPTLEPPRDQHPSGCAAHHAAKVGPASSSNHFQYVAFSATFELPHITTPAAPTASDWESVSFRYLRRPSSWRVGYGTELVAGGYGTTSGIAKVVSARRRATAGPTCRPAGRGSGPSRKGTRVSVWK